jgi:DNA-binding NarL/FixJ family response regulator
LLDLRMPGMGGLAVLERLRERYPQVAVVIFSGVDDPAVISEALRRGAAAYLLKHVEPHDLAATIRGAVDGTFFTAADVSASATKESPEIPLSRREIAVLKALESGGSNRQVAERLFIAEQTVKFHLTNIYRKLGVSSRIEAIHYAYEHGLLERPLTHVA